MSKKCLGALILLFLAAFALLEPVVNSADPATQHLANAFHTPSAEAWLGTDQFGRDMLARLASGIRLSFVLALLSVATAAVVGVATGVVAAWRRGWWDSIGNFLVNTLLALPGLVLVLLFAALAPGSFIMIYCAISLILWVEYFRVVRAVSITVIQGPELQSSQLLGFGPWYLFKRHLWPALADNVLALASFGAATAIIMMSSVGFVYVGLKPPTAELGLMIVELFPYYSDAPWLLLQPLTALCLLVLGFHLLSGRQS